MKNRKYVKWFLLGILVILTLLFSLTYLPHKVINIEPSNVSKVIIFDGNTGNELEITDRKNLYYFITNLNNIRFQKGKPSIGYMGYSFRTTFLDHSGKVIKEVTINSSDTIRYNGFFYKSQNSDIDYDYLVKLTRE